MSPPTSYAALLREIVPEIGPEYRIRELIALLDRITPEMVMDARYGDINDAAAGVLAELAGIEV